MSSIFVTSPWFRFAFPLILLAAMWYEMSNVTLIVQANRGLASSLPYALFITTIAVASIFKQSRMAMVACAMATSYWIIQTRLQTPLNAGSTLLELSLLCLLLPVACLLSYAFNNSGLFSLSFFLYLAMLFLFSAFGYMVVDIYQTNPGKYNFINELLFSVPQLSKLPFIIVLYLLAIVGLTGILVLIRNRTMDVFIYSSVLMSSVTFIFFQLNFISSIMFSMSGAFMLLYLISASHEMAFNDRLTKLPGRHAMDIDMRSLGRKFTIAMLDIDHFKQFNDTYGHDTGDDVLKLVASRIRKIRGRAKVYRYGGEEFTILFKGKTALEAREYLEQLRVDIEQYDLVLRDRDSRPKNDRSGAKNRTGKRDNSVNITVSIGVCDSSVERNVKEAIKRADEALYQAKESGRNCVKLAG